MIDMIPTEFYTISYITIAVSLLAAVFFVLKRDTKRLSSIFLFSSAFCVFLWMVLTSIDAHGMVEAQKGYYEFVIPHILAGAGSLFFVFFSLTFTKKRLYITRLNTLALITPFAFVCLLILVAPRTFLSGVSNDIEYGWAYMAFLFVIIVYSFQSLRLLWFRYKVSAGVFQTVTRSIFAVYLTVTILVLALAIIHIFTNEEFIRLLYLILLFIGYLTISFQLMKFHRWRMKPFLSELFVFFVSAILLIQIFFTETVQGIFIDAATFLFFVLSGHFLIRNVNHEAHLQDEIEMLVKDLKEANEKLQVLDRRKSEFVKISAHHLKSPLTAIKGYASMVLEGSFGNLNKDAREALEKIFGASQRLVGIINDFMDISNIESGNMEYEFKRIDLKKLIEGVIEEMKMTIEKSGLKVTFNTDEISGYEISADANKLRQVISNLTDNAIKYTPKGTVHLFLKKEKSKGTIHLTITDTGIGMSKETIDNLFEKFSRAHDANKVNTGGSGLGLFVAKEIMKKHNAKIWVESPGEGKGATFHLVFNAQ